jgi:hypothetical protein
MSDVERAMVQGAAPLRHPTEEQQQHIRQVPQLMTLDVVILYGIFYAF